MYPVPEYCIQCGAQPEPNDKRWIMAHGLWEHEHNYHWYPALPSVSDVVRLNLIYSEGLGL
jgi:hypothetical protein